MICGVCGRDEADSTKWVNPYPFNLDVKQINGDRAIVVDKGEEDGREHILLASWLQNQNQNDGKSKTQTSKSGLVGVAKEAKVGNLRPGIGDFRFRPPFLKCAGHRDLKTGTSRCLCGEEDESGRVVGVCVHISCVYGPVFPASALLSVGKSMLDQVDTSALAPRAVSVEASVESSAEASAAAAAAAAEDTSTPPPPSLTLAWRCQPCHAAVGPKPPLLFVPGKASLLSPPCATALSASSLSHSSSSSSTAPLPPLCDLCGNRWRGVAMLPLHQDDVAVGRKQPLSSSSSSSSSSTMATAGAAATTANAALKTEQQQRWVHVVCCAVLPSREAWFVDEAGEFGSLPLCAVKGVGRTHEGAGVDWTGRQLTCTVCGCGGGGVSWDGGDASEGGGGGGGGPHSRKSSSRSGSAAIRSQRSAPAQCSVARCCVAVHGSCALKGGCYMDLRGVDDQGGGAPLLCPSHTRAAVHEQIRRWLKAEWGLWAKQRPTKPPPLPMAAAAASSSSAQRPLVDVLAAQAQGQAQGQAHTTSAPTSSSCSFSTLASSPALALAWLSHLRFKGKPMKFYVLALCWALHQKKIKPRAGSNQASGSKKAGRDPHSKCELDDEDEDDTGPLPPFPPAELKTVLGGMREYLMLRGGDENNKAATNDDVSSSSSSNKAGGSSVAKSLAVLTVSEKYAGVVKREAPKGGFNSGDDGDGEEGDDKGRAVSPFVSSFVSSAASPRNLKNKNVVSTLGRRRRQEVVVALAPVKGFLVLLLADALLNIKETHGGGAEPREKLTLITSLLHVVSPFVPPPVARMSRLTQVGKTVYQMSTIRKVQDMADEIHGTHDTPLNELAMHDDKASLTNHQSLLNKKTDGDDVTESRFDGDDDDENDFEENPPKKRKPAESASSRQKRSPKLSPSSSLSTSSAPSSSSLPSSSSPSTGVVDTGVVLRAGSGLDSSAPPTAPTPPPAAAPTPAAAPPPPAPAAAAAASPNLRRELDELKVGNASLRGELKAATASLAEVQRTVQGLERAVRALQEEGEGRRRRDRKAAGGEAASRTAARTTAKAAGSSSRVTPTGAPTVADDRSKPKRQRSGEPAASAQPTREHVIAPPGSSFASVSELLEREGGSGLVGDDEDDDTPPPPTPPPSEDENDEGGGCGRQSWS